MQMPPERIAPLLILILSVISGMGYLLTGDTRRGLYFLFAAGLTATVVF